MGCESGRYSTVALEKFVLFLALFLIAPHSRAQSTYTAQLSGVVTDSSGGVIVGAKVILTDEATNVPTTAMTGKKGIYVLTGLRPARYTIRAEAHITSSGDLCKMSQHAVVISGTSRPGSISGNSMSRTGSYASSGMF